MFYCIEQKYGTNYKCFENTVDPDQTSSFRIGTLSHCTRKIVAKEILRYISLWGWSGSANLLGKLPVSGRPTDLDYSRARAYCACGRCGWRLFGHFFSHLLLLFSFSLSLGDGPI